MRVLWLAAFGLMLAVTTPLTTSGAADNIQQAAEVWEKAIAAKGSREKLHQIHNLVIIEDDSYTKWFQRKERLSVWFYAFPNKLWMWSDNRPGLLGLDLRVYDADSGKTWKFSSHKNAVVMSPKGPDAELPSSWQVSHVEDGTLVARPIPPTGDEVFDFYRTRAHLCFLLETQWVKPVPLKVEILETELGKVTAVHTQVDAFGRRQRVVFFLDPKTHLPLKVGFRDLDGPLPPKDPDLTSLANYYYWVTLADYVNVDGLQMPTKVGFDKPPTVPIKFQINVAYDESVFERPPSPEAGPYAWRRSSKP